MGHLRTIDKLLLEDVFEMHTGYVLDFSDRRFAQFFAGELKIDIDAPKYLGNGTSKAKRLRCFMDLAEKPLLARAIEALWEYREGVRQNAGKTDTVQNAEARVTALIRALKGEPIKQQEPGAKAASASVVLVTQAQRELLKADLIRVSQLDPHPRGYAFETFLKSIFNVHGLEAREAFRIVGEQIDGSFQLGHETYLLEAKWQNLPTGSADLYSFDGKVQNKTKFARGLFISNSGFTPDGLESFGKGKSIICMNGLDIHDLLERGLSLADVLVKKLRRAVETGQPFVPVRDLFA